MPLLTGEQVAFCNSVDLLELVKEKGLAPKKVGMDSYKIAGFGGLYINPVSNQWNCFAAGKGGGPIQFLMFTERTTWRKAAEELLKGRYELMPEMPRRSKKDERKEFVLPGKNNTFKHIFAYLLNTRKLEKEIVYHFVQTKQLYENTQKSCVFVAYDEEQKPRFASYRSTATGSSIKGNILGGDKHYVFAQEGAQDNDRLFIFESPIDLMSYLTLLHQANPRNRLGNLPQHFISLEGLAQMGLDHYLLRYPAIKNLTFCIDNDEWGNKAFERLKTHYVGEGYKVMRHAPDAPAKDFNEMLVMKTLARDQELAAEDEDEEEMEMVHF